MRDLHFALVIERNRGDGYSIFDFDGARRFTACSSSM
jgi:hypothetical protein